MKSIISLVISIINNSQSFNTTAVCVYYALFEPAIYVLLFKQNHESILV